MYCSVRIMFLIRVICCFWVITSSEKMLADSENEQEQIVIAEHSGLFGISWDTQRNINFPFLQSLVLHCTELMMEDKTHNFMGKSYSEMTASSVGIAAGNAFANATATVLDHAINPFTLSIESTVGKDGWYIKLIPDGRLVSTAIMFAVYYSAHNKNYDLYAMDRRGTVALYTGNAAFGLAYGQIEKAFNKGFELLTGSGSALFGSAATSLVTGLVIGLLATKAKVDIAGDKFNIFSVLSTALAVGHTVAYSGKTIRLGVKSILVSRNMPEATAERWGGAATGVAFTSTIMLLTVFGSKIATDLKNYHGKLIGDMTKNIGLILSVDLMRPGIQMAQNAWNSATDRMPIPDILKRLSYAIRDPAMLLASHQLLMKALTRGIGGVEHVRIYDLIIGYSLGGFMGLLESPYKIITETNWSEHALIWGLAGISTLAIDRWGSKVKVD